jgi:hypothetical protein
MLYSSPTRIIAWQDVEPIFRFYISVWPNHIPLNWATLSWQMLHKCGLTVFNNDEEELKVRSYAVALSAIYYEYCHRTSFSDSENFHAWDASRIKEFKLNFITDLERDEELLFCVKRCLIEQLGKLEFGSELWVNCVESRQGFVFNLSEKVALRDKLMNHFHDDINFSRGRSFLLGRDIDDISYYESVSGL